MSESDKIVSCLTKDFGLIKLVAKGSRKLKSRFSGSIEPFTITQIAFYRKEDAELAILREVELKQSYFHHARNLHIVSTFAYFGELLSEFIPPDEPNEVIYRMAKACFAASSEVSEDHFKINLAVLYFEIWMLRITGFLPDLHRCADCRRVVGNQDRIIWAAENRFLCENCGQRRGNIIGPAQLAILRDAHRLSPLQFISAFTNQNELIEGLTFITRRLIKQVLLRDIEYWSNKNWQSAAP